MTASLSNSDLNAARVAPPPTPEGPTVGRRPRADWGDRVINLSIVLPCAAMLGVGAWLHPDPSGAGTHTQLGMAPCGMFQVTGIPCPSCGMTTSVCLAAHGQLVQSFLTQPGGALLAVAAAMAVIVFGYALVRDLSPRPLLRRFARPWIAVTAFVLFLAAWGYKAAVTLGGA